MPPIGALMQLIAYGAQDFFLSTPPTKKEIATYVSERIKFIPNRKYFNFIFTSKNRYGFNHSNNILGIDNNAFNLIFDNVNECIDTLIDNISKKDELKKGPKITFWKVNFN